MVKEILAVAFAIAVAAMCDVALVAAALAVMLRQYRAETERMFSHAPQRMFAPVRERQQ